MTDTVGDYLLQRMTDWGIDCIFGYPGDGINGIMGALGRAESRFRYVRVRHEEMSAFMAAGYAKFTGRTGGHLRSRRDPPAQRPLRCPRRPRAGGRDRRPAGGERAGQRLPAGGRPQAPVQRRMHSRREALALLSTLAWPAQ